jgi:hypothetical protein
MQKPISAAAGSNNMLDRLVFGAWSKLEASGHTAQHAL